MRRNILGDIVLTPEDYAKFVIEEFGSQRHNTFLIKQDTDHGFFTDANVSTKGIYCLFRKENPVYVGCTENNIRVRLGRFFAAVRGTEHWDENHPAAYKYVDVFGKDLTDVTFKFCQMSQKDLPTGMTLEHVETKVVENLKPYFNIETCGLYKFDNRVVVHSSNGVIQYA